MKNIYITVIPLQGKQHLEKIKYEPNESCGISCEKETRFPIIPAILSTQDADVENKVIAVRLKNQDTDRNLELFREELAENGISAELKVIELEENQKYATGVNMFLQLLDEIEDDSDVYACITFGTKLMPLLITYVLNTLSYTRRNAQVKGIYYGEIQRNAAESIRFNLYDVASFLRIDDLVRQVHQLHPEDTEGFIKKLLSHE